jgi:hypothetical protein
MQIDERAEFEKEFPVSEGLHYCAQRGSYITALGAKTSDSFAREHYAYRAGFAAWKRRAWKHIGQVQHLKQANADQRQLLNDAAQQDHQPCGYFPQEEA